MTSGRPSLDGARVVVVCNEQPGVRMAGPAIRAINMARQLAAAGGRVVVTAPDPVDTDLGVEVRPIGKPSLAAFRRLGDAADVVVTQPQRVDVALGLHSGKARVIYDCYVPAFVEYPASLAADRLPPRTRAKLVERNQREYATAIQCGDAFLVASSRQKDFLWGALGQTGRLQQPTVAHAEAWPRVAVVPFGLPDVPPRPATAHPIKGSLVPSDSIVALWAGGVWNWFDPVTVIRGLRQARLRDPRLRLVFLGVGHPSSNFRGQAAATEALSSPEVRDAIAEGSVVFADEWVPYEERGAYLSDADLAVCAHFDSPETRMSFRTRFLDHLWAGLPTISTAGGVLTDDMVAAGAAVSVAPGSADEWSAALLALAADPAQRVRMADAARELGRMMTWSQVSRPLTQLVGQVLAGDAGPRVRPSLAATAGYLAVAVENRLR